MHMPTLKYLRLAAAGALAFAAGGLMTACQTSDYLDVTSPSRIPASSLEDPANASEE